jgi:hypothetical protein
MADVEVVATYELATSIARSSKTFTGSLIQPSLISRSRIALVSRSCRASGSLFESSPLMSS